MVDDRRLSIDASTLNPYHLLVASQPIEKFHTKFLCTTIQSMSFNEETKIIELEKYELIFLTPSFYNFKIAYLVWSLFEMSKLRLSPHNSNKSFCFLSLLRMLELPFSFFFQNLNYAMLENSSTNKTCFNIQKTQNWFYAA